jgi:hypothetical protein
MTDDRGSGFVDDDDDGYDMMMGILGDSIVEMKKLW